MENMLNVLIVDDDETILSLLEEVFSNDPDLRITTLSDSEKAYQIIESGQFDLIITDLMMPKIDGLRLLQRSLSVKPDALVVIITGYASLETTLRAIHGGVYDYITKPFRIEEFRLLVHNAAARIHLMRQNKALTLEIKALQEQIAQLREELNRKGGPPGGPRFEPSLRPDSLPGEEGSNIGSAEQGGASRVRLSYEKGMETADERYDREIKHLEDLFFSGQLTAEVFESARQRLKTMI